MASVTHTHRCWSLRHLFAIALSRLHRAVPWFIGGRRMVRRTDVQPIPNHAQHHFGSLDDQLLNDLGLQRSEIRAAEYGILPGDQALHHKNDTTSRDHEDRDMKPQPRSGA